MRASRSERYTSITLGALVRCMEIDLDEELGKVKEEQVNRAVAAQETRRDLFLELQEKRLPIEDDLEEDSQAKPDQGQPEVQPPVIDPMTGMPMAGTEGDHPQTRARPYLHRRSRRGHHPAQPLTPEEAEQNPPALLARQAHRLRLAAPGPGVVVPYAAPSPARERRAAKGDAQGQCDRHQWAHQRQ